MPRLHVALEWVDPIEADPEVPAPDGTEGAIAYASHQDATAAVFQHTYINGDGKEWDMTVKYTATVFGGDATPWEEGSPEFDALDGAKDWAEVALGIIYAPDPEEWGGPDNAEDWTPPMELPEEPF